MRKKLFYILSLIIISTSFSSLLVVGYWLYFPYKIVEFTDLVFPVLNENKIVKSGDVVAYRAKYCKYINASFTVTRSFVDGLIYATSPVESNKPMGCWDNIVYIEVPRGIPSGEVVLEMLYRTQINPIRTIDIIKKTEPFYIQNDTKLNSINPRPTLAIGKT